MKRLQFCLFTIFMLFALGGNAVDIYVAPHGNDVNEGSRDRPLATLSAALRKARELRRLQDPSIRGGIQIILRGGLYPLHETVSVRPEDSGTADSPTIITAMSGELPVLSGGVQLRGWQKVTGSLPQLPGIARNKIWVTDVPGISGRSLQFRQLWVNGRKAVRAKSTAGNKMDRILDWNKKDGTCWIPIADGKQLKEAAGMEMFIQQWWAIAVLRIRKMEIHHDSARLYFHEPESTIQNEHPWPAPWLSDETGNSAFYLTNGIQFLDEPGEWFLDAVNAKLYYWPRAGEQLNNATVIAPVLETLLAVRGSVDEPVSHLTIKGVQFQHTGWLRPSHQGHVPHQDGLYMTEAYRLKPAGVPGRPSLDNQAWVGRPASAISVNFAEHTLIENCEFEHLASTAIDYHLGVHHNRVAGNLFRDVGGNALLAGEYSDGATEIHKVYHPADERVVCDSLTVTNNLFTDVANEDWSCVAVGVGYARNTVIEHNEIENTSYSGISLGWGWNPAPNVSRNNIVDGNYIHHYGKHNYDCAGIYTLSAQPGSMITHNRIDSIYKAPYAHLPSHWFYLYCDEGSSYFTVKNNWAPSTKFLQNANGPGNVWSDNGPTVSKDIKQSAGLEAAYRYLLPKKTAKDPGLETNEEHAELIELVFEDGYRADLSKLKALLRDNQVDTAGVYAWKNHYVVFSKMVDVEVLRGKIREAFPGTIVRVYYDLFYRFDRKRHCPGATIAPAWDHVILTSNLVDNKRMQAEYLHYHENQFTQWPDVSMGFCHADFQQLLVFRNGRQLMLVISIPKGESLDKLNPLTTENNPRMVEWNKIMSRYQEGIKGTQAGEKWVELKRK
jgi:hypothetical protein